MGALNPLSVIAGVAPVLNTVNTLTNQIRNVGGSSERRAQELALAQLQERQAIDNQNAQAQANLDYQKLQTQTQAAEDERRATLRRAMARQRASFGGAGVSTNGGSGEAVLLGLFDESDAEREEREKLDSLRSQAIDLSLANRSSLNVLQRSQLEARQKLTRTLF